MALKSDELLTLLQADWESLSSITDKDEHNKRWFFLADTMAAQISDIRRAAAIALGQLGDADAVGGLIDALHDKADANVRDAAAQALRMIGTLAALAALTRD